MSDSNYISVRLSPKALRFVLAAIEHQQAHLQSLLDADALSEDDAADASNDYAFLDAIRGDLAKLT